jgi:hypothetical protein
MTVQLADSSIRHPEGTAESLLVKVGGSYVLADFMILDMQYDGGMPLILGDHSLEMSRQKSMWGRSDPIPHWERRRT